MNLAEPKHLNRPQRHRSHRRLRLERLCDRVVMDGIGLGASAPLPWFDPGALTYSYALDGTKVAGEDSQLFSRLGEIADPNIWQEQFANAFNAWLEPLGVSTDEVPDSGDDFGVAGRTQGDLRFGDIRIAAVPLSTGVRATSVPHSTMVQGSWAGDILINSDSPWSNLQEVFSVALHEFGHVLGLPHSTDSTSVMFAHGVHDVAIPTPSDVGSLADLYAGIRFEEEEDEGEDQDDEDRDEPLEGEESTDEQDDSIGPNAFDTSNAVSLTPSLGSTLRYVSEGQIPNSSANVLYKLLPSIAKAEDLENLNVVFQSVGTGRLAVDITILDQEGVEVESRVLHDNQGTIVVQANDVDSEDDYYVLISSSIGVSRLGAGDFEIIMDYGPEQRLSERIAEVTFSSEQPVREQSLSVSSSRLVHLHLDSRERFDPETTIRAALFDSNDKPMTRVVLHPGESRSAPVIFLPAGDYRLLFSSNTNGGLSTEHQVEVFLDEVSIDVGPGVSDPTDGPYLPCDEPGADPDYCYSYTPIVIAPPAPVDPIPQPSEPDYPWWWGYDCSEYLVEDFPDVQMYNPDWWQFYVEICQPTNTPPINTPPTNTPPTNTPPTNSPPTNTPPTNTPPTNTPPINTPPTNTPPTNTPPTNSPPTNTPPTNSPPINTPSINTPPINTPPINTPPTNSPPANTPPTNTPPANTPSTVINYWQNPIESRDVSNDSTVSSLDALIVINILGRFGGNVPLNQNMTTSIGFADVNGDFVVSALDALAVINAINRQGAVEGEAIIFAPTRPLSAKVSNNDWIHEEDVPLLF